MYHIKIKEAEKKLYDKTRASAILCGIYTYFYSEAQAQSTVEILYCTEGLVAVDFVRKKIS